MNLFSRSMPKELRGRVRLPQGERVVTYAETNTGELLVATQKALYFADERVPWDLVGRANWVEPNLDVVFQHVPGGPTSNVHFALTNSGELPTALRERVTASIVIQERVLLDGEKGALMIARKGVDDGEIRWSVVFDEGLDPNNPVLRQRADEMLALMRGQFGI